LQTGTPGEYVELEKQPSHSQKLEIRFI